MVRPIDTAPYPIQDATFAAQCRAELARSGALVLDGFFAPEVVEAVLEETGGRVAEAYFTADSHNVYLTPDDPDLPRDHPANRRVASSKGCLADDQIAESSPLRQIYNSPEFRDFLCATLDIDEIHPYADTLSSINVHFHLDGQELGWHFDNSSFAVTFLVQAPLDGGVFEYVPDLRDAAADDPDQAAVAAVLDGDTEPTELAITPGALVLFRGREALHRITPTRGERPRILVVFAYNDEREVRLCASAQRTFYGRES